jgi:hypothetical protein
MPSPYREPGTLALSPPLAATVRRICCVCAGGSKVPRPIALQNRVKASGVPAAGVAAVVRRVLESRRPPRRVSAGKAGERAGLLARRLLPFRAFEAAAKSSLGV